MIWTIDDTIMEQALILYGNASSYVSVVNDKAPFFYERLKPRVMLKSNDCNTIVIQDFTELQEIVVFSQNDSYAVSYTIYKKCCDRYELIQNETVLANGDKVIFDTSDYGPGVYRVVFDYSVVYTSSLLGAQTLTRQDVCEIELDCCPGLQEGVLCKAKELLRDIGCVVTGWTEIGRDARQKIKDLIMIDHYIYLLDNFDLSCPELDTIDCALNKFKNC